MGDPFAAINAGRIARTTSSMTRNDLCNGGRRGGDSAQDKYHGTLKFGQPATVSENVTLIAHSWAATTGVACDNRKTRPA